MNRIDPSRRRRRTGWAVALLAGLLVAPPQGLLPTLGQEAASPVPGWRAQGTHRAAPVRPGPGKGPGFELQPPARTGVAFTNHLDEATVARNRLLELGSGVALGDVDGDGRVDVYLCRLEGDNALYRNLGDWRFEDITSRAGVACPDQYSTGCNLADLDGDGDLDLLVNSLGGGTRAFRNDGKGRFTEAELGFLRNAGATSMALADVEGDGDLDVYVTHYRTDTFHDPPKGGRFVQRRQPDGSTVIEPKDRYLGVPAMNGNLEVLERGEPDALYINRGGTNVVLVPWNVGLFIDEQSQALSEPPRDWGLAVMFRDLDGDHRPDLYVCNDFVHWPDRLWLNLGKRFQAAPPTALRNQSLSSMSMDAADIDRDGHDDFFVAEMLSPRREDRARQRPDTLDGVVRWPVERPGFRPEVTRNTLQRSRGDGTWADIAPLAGVAATDWTWSSAFLDVDLDGWEDLLLTTGNFHDVQDIDAQGRILREGLWKNPETRRQALALLPRRSTPSVALRNRRDLTFEDASTAWGFDQRGFAHGMAFGDLDNDGDLDVVVNELNGPVRLLRNGAQAPRLAVRLKGARGNTAGIGARIRVTGGPVAQHQEMISGGRYLSGDQAQRVFAAGEARSLDVEVVWRSGRRTEARGVAPNQVVEIEEKDTLDPLPAPAIPQPLFQSLVATPDPVPREPDPAEFERQPLLPRRLGTEAPGLAWADWDGDGDPDLWVGADEDGRPRALRNDGPAGFVTDDTVRPRLPEPGPEPGWLTSVLIVPGPSPGAAPLRWIGGRWPGKAAPGDTPRFADLSPSNAAPPIAPSSIPSDAAATGPLASADVDGDGLLDLLVGARTKAGRYPETAPTLLLPGTRTGWGPPQTLTDSARVSGAVFTDLDADGDSDLVLAGDWDSLRLFRNDGGRLIEATAGSGLESWKGFWNGVTAGDFDGDGRMDLVASNWGRNWRIDQTGGPAGATPATGRPAPVRLVSGEFSEPGRVLTLLASADPATGRQTPWRAWSALAKAIPSLVERVSSHRDFAARDVTDLLGPLAARAASVEADTFDSMVFLNRGGRFEAVPLPIEAQLAPAFGLSVADFDGDGQEDLFLAQNFFGVDAETSRQDAGTGLVLLGDGRGRFRSLPPREAGFSLPGEQRASAVADVDGDGRPDLAVGQHAGITRIFRNAGGRPGVRVRLEGPPGNPEGVGAVLRLVFGDRTGPAREVHVGSGFRSQDSADTVLAAPTLPTALEVRWPAGPGSPRGDLRRLEWPAGARAVTAGLAGGLRRR
ncbi:MAG: FG-GAP-like repeat-containing protein [Verrucomicrobium sp.]|nr:FG-GAP-like repeat-containing protein [Verrucomicrobium sp.]